MSNKRYDSTEICKKVVDDIASREDAKAAVDWFSSSIEGLHHLSEMIDRDIYLLEDEPVPDISSYKSQLMLLRINNSIREKRLKRRLLRVVAALVPFIIFVGFGIYLNIQTGIFSTPVYTEIHIPNGEKARILFQDGSEVFLNADTRISYPQKFGLWRRNVHLQGEAYFNIASNRRRFVVHLGDMSVEVLGTSFNVNARENSDNVSITLDEGEIVFNTPINSYSLSTGQEVVHNRVTGESHILALARTSNRSLWKSGIIFMDNMPLTNVLEVLERRFDVRFDVKDADALRYSYTLTSRQNSVEGVLEEMQRIAPVRFRRAGDRIEVFL
jgi:ferric-dicitrate binding protein FerR (iron transport regulator)